MSGMKREQTFTTACLERLSALVIVIEDPATVGFLPRCSCGITGAAITRSDSLTWRFQATLFRADTRVSYVYYVHTYPETIQNLLAACNLYPCIIRAATKTSL